MRYIILLLLIVYCILKECRIRESAMTHDYNIILNAAIVF